jgi:hypothetical protein
MKTKLHLSPFSTNHISRTFFHSALMTAVVLLLALVGAKLLPSSSSSAKQNTENGGGRSCPHCAPRADQIIYIPLIDLPEAQGSEIVFNSRSPQEMYVTPTFYKLDGTAIVGKQVLIQSSEIRYVDLKKLIPGPYRNDRDWGGMSLAYTGVPREMWAQLRLLGVNGGSNVDEFFNVPQEVRSDLQEAVWWVPQQSTSIIALGNITDTATGAIVRFGDGQEQAVSLAPHATEIIRRAPLLQASGESVTINITGAAGSVIPTGLIVSADGAFNCVIRFYETKMAKQPHLFGTGLRLAGTIPRMALKNTSSATITATPEFIPLGGMAAGEPVKLPALALAPQQTAEVDLNPLMNVVRRRSDLDTVSVQVTNNGAPGSLIGALYSSDKTTGVNYDVPLRDSGPVRTMTGSYPWKIDDDFTTIVYLTNISDGPAGFVGEIRYDGGKYVIDPHKLAAGETAVFDLRKMIEEQKPDSSERRLPLNVLVGQFKWAIHGATGGKVILIGRAEMVSRSQRISTSYSCSDSCPPKYSGSIVPGGLTLDVESQGTMGDWETGTYSNGTTVGPYQVPGITWSSFDPTIATVGGGTVTALAPGYTTITSLIDQQEHYTWDQIDGFCLDDGYTYDINSNASVTAKPSISSLDPSRGLIGQTIRVTVVGTGFVAPAGVNVDGGVDKGVNATVISIGPRSIVADFAVKADALAGNHPVTVTANGPTSNSVNFFVQTPKSLVRQDYQPAPPARQAPGGVSQLYVITDGDIVHLDGTVDPGQQHRCGAYRNYLYQLMDQGGQPIKQVIIVDEKFPSSGYSGPPGLKRTDGPAETNNVGWLEDLNALTTPAGSCLTADPNSTMTQNFSVTIGTTTYNLTTVVKITLKYDPTTNTYTVDNAITTP